MMQRLSSSQENYLEWIYRFSLEGPVRGKDLADKLDVRRPSVSRAVAGLARAGMVEHEAYGDIRLTEAGLRAGRAIVRRAQCLTRLLVELLDMDPAEADLQVHRMQHVLDDDVLSRLEVLVGFTRTSEAWLKRLHHRIRSREPSHQHPQMNSKATPAGSTTNHSGRTREK